MGDYKRTEEGVIDFNQFKQKKEQAEDQKPLFTEPTLITLGDPEDESKQEKFLLLLNLVKDSKQFLALESMTNNDNEIAVVEALVEDGQFAGVQPVQSEEEYEEVVEIVQGALQAAQEDDDDAKH